MMPMAYLIIFIWQKEILMSRRKIFLAGDSTVAYNSIETYPQTGWGQALHLYLQKDIEIINHAKNGCSSKSFLEEGRLLPIEAEIGQGDYLFIQFGHNDQKEDVARATDPATTYKEYLEKYIAVAKEKGAHALLITSPYRRHFHLDGTLKEAVHGTYPQAMLEVAKAWEIPCIDLCSKSVALLQTEGDQASKRFFMHLAVGQYDAYPDGKVDDTHFTYEGAVAMAGLVVEGLKELEDTFSTLVK